MTCPVVILGAGLTGMSAALALQHKGVSHRLLEKQDQAGGLATTRTERDYHFDQTGHLLHLRDDDRLDQLCALVGERLQPIARNSVVYSEGTYTRYPYQANLHGLPKATAYECLLGFVRALGQTPSSPPRNFEEYCRRHFGDGITDHFMVPYNSRLWGVPPGEITADWCERFVPLPKLEDVLRGALGLEPAELGYNTRLYHPSQGIGALAQGMQRALTSLELNQAPRAIDPYQHRVVLDGETLNYDVLVSSIPLPQLLCLMSGLPDAVVQARRRLRSTALNYLDVALRRPPLVGAHWIYVPEPAFPFYRVGSYSALSPAMAPPGTGSLYVELVDRQEQPPESIWPSVLSGLCRMGIIDGEADVLFKRLRRIEYAYVIYDHAYAESLGTVQSFLREHRILSTGRYGGWNYSAMEDALRFGAEAAEQAEDWLIR